MVIVVAGCDNSRRPTDDDNDNVVLTSFPNAVGMLWVYEVHDSLTEATDTVWVSVTDTAGYPAGQVVLRWRLNWNSTVSGENRYAYSAIGMDTIDFWTESRPQLMFLERFVLPMSRGTEWIAPIGADTSRVADIGTVTVPAGSFRGSAHIERKWNPGLCGDGNWSWTWIAPDVGVVSRYMYSKASDGGSTWFTVNQTWELLEYHLGTFPLSRFPNTVGTEWVYQVVDTSIDLVDTVTVAVVSKVEVSWADSATVWQFIGREFTDTLYVGVAGNRVHVAHDTIIRRFNDWYYEFPLAVGRHWGAHPSASFPTIDGKGSMRTPAGDFPSAFHYRMFDGAFNYYWEVDDWLVPGVGIVARTYTIFDSGPAFTQEWTLLEYEIASWSD